uniref:Exc1 n=2 Tax=Pectobacterium atrosepticum TaxID=29471 RepID=B8X8Z8_PECAT|nr:Exc1 [Pectobacterium atrosepticum]
MAWHTVSQAQKLTQKSRRTLYRDMASGLVSYRTNRSGHRELETSELIRHYGDLSVDGTASRPTVAQPDGTQNEAVLLDEIRALRQEVAELKEMMLRLEHKPEPALSPATTKWWQRWRRPSK